MRRSWLVRRMLRIEDIAKAEVHVVDRSIIEGIIKVCERSFPNETVGLLYGNFYRWRANDGRTYRYIEVRSFVSLPGAEMKTTVRVDVERAVKVIPKGKDIIVGWYHSHPGYGLFLSQIDIDTHRYAFSERHTALVVDPTRRDLANKMAFFTLVPDGRYREMSFVIWSRREKWRG